MKFRRFIAGVAVGVLAPALALLIPVRAHADTCNGFITIKYPNGSGPFHIGDDVVTRITFGTDDITGGVLNVLKLTNFFFNRACDVDAAGGITPNGLGIDAQGHPNGCKPDPAAQPGFPVTFDGIVPGSFHCVFGNQPDPNVTNDGGLFAPKNGPLQLAANLGPAACRVDFKQKITGLSGDSTPNVIEQLVGYHAAACDSDDNHLDSGNYQTAAINVTVVGKNFDCYQNTGGRTPASNTVNLVDRFGDTTVKLAFEHRVCPPANKNDEDPSAVGSDDHLTGYAIKKNGADANADVSLTNQFGTVSGHVGKAVRLLVPAAKALGKNNDPGQPTGTRHFQCYNFEADVADFSVKLQDQFIVIKKFKPLTIDPAKSATVDFPDGLLLCVPVDKNGETPGAENDPNALLCYHRIDNIPDLVQDIKVSTRDQFQFDPNLNITEFQELCVASTIQ